jgi:DNA polymerase III epsilon subunit-like protein
MERHRSMTDWTSLNYVVVDVEGNGHQPPDLVELAAVPIVGGTIGEPIEWIVRPDQPITPFARRIHGITNDEVEHADTFAAIEHQVRQTLNADALIAHNAHVDVSVLRRKLGEWDVPEVFDTLNLARRLVTDQNSYKLGSLVTAFDLAEGLAPDLKPHRAAYDALVTARLFVYIAGRRTLEELRNQPPGGEEDAPSLF